MNDVLVMHFSKDLAHLLYYGVETYRVLTRGLAQGNVVPHSNGIYKVFQEDAMGDIVHKINDWSADAWTMQDRVFYH